MPIPRWFINGPRRVDPTSGEILCTLDPPFRQHATLEILVHCTLAGGELRHYDSGPGIKQILLVGNRDTVYLTVEPGDRLVLHYIAVGGERMVQGSLYVF